jgi:hypothetical protein
MSTTLQRKQNRNYHSQAPHVHRSGAPVLACVAHMPWRRRAFVPRIACPFSEPVHSPKNRANGIYLTCDIKQSVHAPPVEFILSPEYRILALPPNPDKTVGKLGRPFVNSEIPLFAPGTNDPTDLRGRIAGLRNVPDDFTFTFEWKTVAPGLQIWRIGIAAQEWLDLARDEDMREPAPAGDGPPGEFRRDLQPDGSEDAHKEVDSSPANGEVSISLASEELAPVPGRSLRGSAESRSLVSSHDQGAESRKAEG